MHNDPGVGRHAGTRTVHPGIDMTTPRTPRIRALGLASRAHAALLIVALAPTLAGCGSHQEDDAPAAKAAAAPAPAAAVAAAARGDIAASYRCDGGHRVDLVEGDREAQARLSDGRTIALEVVQGSAPRTYTGSGLYVELRKDGGATLTDEGSGTSECKQAS